MNVWTKLFDTNVRLLGRMRIATRLFITVALLGLPLSILTALTVITQNRAIDFGNKEIDGTQYNKPIFEVLRLSVQYFHITLQYARGDVSLNQVSAKRSELQSAMQSVEAQHVKFGASMDDSEKWNALQTAWQPVSGSPLSTEDALKKFPAFIQSVIDLNNLIGDSSNLILDPDLDTYYLMDTTLLRLVSLINIMGKIQMEGDTVLFSTTPSASEVSDVIELTTILKYESDQCQKSLTSALRANPSLTDSLKGQGEKLGAFVQDYSSYVRSLTRDGDKSRGEFSQKSERLATLIHEYYSVALTNQQALLEKRIVSFRREQILSIGAVAFTSFFTLLVQNLIIFSITRPLYSMTERMKDLAKGDADLTIRVEQSSNNELGKLGLSLNSFMENLASLILQIRAASAESRSAYTKLSEMVDRFTNTSQNQAAAAEESSASVQEVVASIENIAEAVTNQSDDIRIVEKNITGLNAATRDLNQMMRGLRTLANQLKEEQGRGSRVAENAGENTKRILDLSRQINEIVAMITDISDRTNLLALNAAIEAARAGDAGRGFAVVADEISKLAELTAGNASTIKKLIAQTSQGIETEGAEVGALTSLFQNIDSSINEIQDSTARMAGALTTQVETTGQIENHIRKITSLEKGIETAANEQRKAMKEIGSSVESLSMETQNIAAGSNELQTTAVEITGISLRLQDLVSRFRIE